MGNNLESTSAQVDVVIVGGGPTGLGAAYRLHQYGLTNWLLLDAEKHPGGLAGSIKTSEGFRFDHGYKTLSSRYEYFDNVIEDIYSAESNHTLRRVPRVNYVFIRGKMVRYPVQNNLSGLPPTERNACVLDLVKAKLEAKDSSSATSVNLDQYLVSEWGENLCNLFFRPYIFKALAYPTSKLKWEWVKAKVPPSNFCDDWEGIMNDKKSDPGWGYDATKVYPKKGGMLGFWRSLVKKLPKSNIRFRNEIANIQLDEKKVTTKEGLEIRYKHLLSSMPLTSLLELAGRSDLTQSMINSSLFVVCVGIRGVSHQPDITGCIYYPESDTIFHRVSVFSNHDPDSVPNDDVKLSTIRLAQSDSDEVTSEEKDGPYWSLLMEISGGPLKSVNEQTIADDAIRDACSVGLLQREDEIISIHLTEMTHGYPLPVISESEKVDEALSWLKSKEIWSRGRFGAFKYEVGDLDCCFIQGVEAVDNILKGESERCITQLLCDVTQTKHTVPRFQVEPFDSNAELKQDDISKSVTSEAITDGDNHISEDANEVLVASETEVNISAGNIRSAITTEPSHNSDSD